MDVYLILGFIIVIMLLVANISSKSSEKKKVFKDNKYCYTAKSSMMTKTESEFFIKLDRIVSDKYYVFPQVHLSAILDHRVNGQGRKYAFSHINSKSVDYVLTNKDTLRPTYAIELDDSTHDRTDRHKRDLEVERIFKGANLPLLRFRNKNVTQDEIINQLEKANKLAGFRQ